MAKRKVNPLTTIKRHLKATRTTLAGNQGQKKLLEDAQAKLDELEVIIPKQEAVIDEMIEVASYLNNIDLGIIEADEFNDAKVEALINRLEAPVEATAEATEATETTEATNESDGEPVAQAV